ncbi:Alpha/Beta hydrolase protein [Podospora appendiculata]|uniref:Alpha/Beta hydrolase protein n=1 Tax=Podospora appendiculata TaxID=314037 RepID=A0AAE0XB60_9PEZI|nr:Alpha/Beta hydrolase protein [Podospora appendiculata]
MVGSHIPFNVPGLAQQCHTWYNVIGNLDAPGIPLVILHGGPGACHDYLLPIKDIASPNRPLSGNEDFWNVNLFVDELDNLLNALGLQGKPFDVYGHSWGGMLAAAWAATSANAPTLRRLMIASSLASMDVWRVGIEQLRRQLPADVQDVLDRADETKDFESPEYQAAVEVCYKRHLSLARPWPAPEVQSALDWFAKDPTTYATMYGHSELYVSGSLRTWKAIPLLSKIKTPTLLINGAEDEAQTWRCSHSLNT